MPSRDEQDVEGRRQQIIDGALEVFAHKGVGLEVLWSQVLILLMFAIVLMTLSIRQFRRQLM